MQNILHFAQDSDTSGFFPQVARWHDRDRYRMYFGTLNPIAPWLRECMLTEGVDCFSCRAAGHVTYPLAMLRLAWFLRSKKIDILHTHLFEPSVIGLTAGVLSGAPVRVMTRHHSDDHTRGHQRLHVRLDQFCARLAQVTIAVSQYTARHMVSEEGARPDNVHVVLNGIDFDRLKLSAPEAPERIISEFGAQGCFVLLIVARLYTDKGHEFLLEALPAIKQRLDRRVLLMIAGTGPSEAAYRRQALSLGCGDNVRFLGFRRDVADLMSAADLVLLPSFSESFGLVLAEALYLGTPVVATRVGGIPEVVQDGIDGILVPPGDSEALGAAIVDLLKDPEKRRAMARAGHEKVATRFGFPAMMRSYELIYEKLSPGSGIAADARSLGYHASP